VLSGYLITALLLGEQATRTRVRIGAFYRRRAMRLLPALGAFVIAHQVFAWTLHLNAAREHSTAIAVLLYFTNWKVAWAPPLSLGGFTAIAIATAIVLLAVLDTNWSGARLLALRPLRAVGRVSYGLYVWHPLVYIWVWYYTRDWSRPARGCAVVVAVAAVTYA